MPGADELQAERVPELLSAMRRAIDTLRDRWLGPSIGGPGATVRGQWVALSLVAVVVFACFFAVGKMTTSAAPVGGGAPATLEGSSSRAAIPAGLSGGSPIAGAVPVAIVAKPRPRPRPASAPATRPLPVEASTTSVAAAPPPATVAAGSEPARAANPTPAPAPSGAGGSAPPGHERGGAGSSSGGASSGGGSFDTSE